MEMEGSGKTYLEFTADCLNSSSQFTENQVDSDICKLAGVVIAEKEVDIGHGIGANEGLPELHVSMEPESTKRNGRYNLRKSLAWDSAFFTNAGVLDPDELSGMITSADNAEKHTLPGIEEDIAGSTESISTLQSDTFTLESLEDDLFLDIRASIQRSSKKASNLTNSSIKTSVAVVDNGAISALKKEDLASQSKSPRLALKKTSSLQSVRVSKQNTGMPGSGKAPKQDSVQSQTTQMKSTGKIGESNKIFPKPPKAIIKPPISSASTKLDPMIVARAKSQCGSSKSVTVSSKGTQPRNMSALNGAKTTLPKPAVSSRSALLGSSSTSRVQSTSSDSSGSISSETPSKKSPLMTARRNLVKSNKVGTAPSGSIAKTPSRTALKNKAPSSKLSAQLRSTKISSNVSPASSISEWSSASSSSSLMVNQSYNNSRTSLDVSSSRSVDSDIILSDPKSLPTDQNVIGHEHQEITVLGNNSKKSSTRTGTLQAPGKPSGLRMPSPKIGFFDGVKSSTRTPNGSPLSQSGLHTALPKSGLQARSSNIKLKSGKVPTARAATALTNIKPDSPKIMPPASFQEKSHSSGNDAGISIDVNGSPLPLELEGNVTGENCPKTGKAQVEDGDKQVVHTGAGAMFSVNLGDLNNKMDLSVDKGLVVEDMKLATLEGSNASIFKCFNQSGAVSVLVNQNQLCEANDKENHTVKYQGQGFEGLGRDVNSKISGNDAGISIDVNRSPLPLELEGNVTGENFPNTGKAQVEDGEKQVVDTGAGAMFSVNLGDLNNEMDLSVHKGMVVEDMKIATLEESNASVSKCFNQSGAESVLVNQNQFCEANDKENHTVKYQGQGFEGLSRDVNSKISGNDAGISIDVNGSPLPLELEGNATGESCPKMGKAQVEDGDKQVVDTGAGAMFSVNLGDLNNKMDLSVHKGMVVEDMKIATLEGSNASVSKCFNQSGAGSVLVNQNQLCEANDNESHTVKYQGQGFEGLSRDVNYKISGQYNEVVSNISDYALLFPPSVPEASPDRAPFALKNSSCNDECINITKESAIQVAEKIGSAWPSSEQKENI